MALIAEQARLQLVAQLKVQQPAPAQVQVPMLAAVATMLHVAQHAPSMNAGNSDAFIYIRERSAVCCRWA